VISKNQRYISTKWQRLLFFIGGVLLLFKISDLLFPLDELNNPDRFSRVVTDENGQILRAFADKNGVWRHPVKLEQVSDNYVEALLNYEDKWFWYHSGINPISIARAFIQNLSCNCIRSGGSTLTMQVARIFYPHERTILGKIQQILRSIQLEWHYSKREILELYLNNAPFGGTIEGIQAASLTYLGKNANELTDAEAALLAVLPQAPSKNRPDRYPARAEAVRNKVLKRLNNDVWSSDRVLLALKEPVLAYAPTRPQYAPLLARELIKQYPDKQVIKTHISLELQQAIESYIKDRSGLFPNKTSAAVLIVDNATQEIKAYIGSTDFNDIDRFGHVDMVQAIRSPGSTLKPFIYGMAIEDGIIHSHSMLLDTPRYNSSYRPENFHKRFSGPVSVTRALQASLNLPAVQVLEALGPNSFYGRLKNAGINLQIPGKPNLSLALGGAGTSLMDLTHLYVSLANNGQLKQLKLTPDGPINTSKYLLSKEASWITYKMLASAPRPDRLHSNVFLSDINPIAWKTGTSYGYRDAWAIGTSEDLTIGVWVGRPDGTPVPGHYGSETASPLLFEILQNIPGHRKVIEKPAEVSIQKICWPIGKLSSDTLSHHCHRQHQAWIDQYKVPPTLGEPGLEQWKPNPYTIWINQKNGFLANKECHIEKFQKREIAIWPRISEPWLPTKWRFYNQLPKLDPSCDDAPSYALRPLSITSIENDNQFKLPEGVKNLELNLSAIGGQGDLDWYLNGRYKGSTLQGHTLPVTILEPGSHELVVIDEKGDLDRIEFEIL